jgi:hypothetical protein
VPRSLDRPNWFIVDEVELARQLTIRSYELFSAIRVKPTPTPLRPRASEQSGARLCWSHHFVFVGALQLFEFFGQPWSKPSTQHLAPNLMAFIEYFNSISRAVSTALLQQRVRFARRPTVPVYLGRPLIPPVVHNAENQRAGQAAHALHPYGGGTARPGQLPPPPGVHRRVQQLGRRPAAVDQGPPAQGPFRG